MDPLNKRRTYEESDTLDTEIAEAIAMIELAEEGMMNWIRNYDPNCVGASDQEVID
ncbi:MAG: hypothetical protein GY816_21690 [Cytophagales bacterium]|nr:hypothetical protein [Cytophagales bacterium]